jgi:hypothetical protein
MRWFAGLASVLVVCLCVSGAGLADEPPQGERPDALAEALRILRIRLEGQLGAAEALRSLGRPAEALQRFDDLERIHAEGMALVEALRHGAGPAAVDVPAEAGASDAPFVGRSGARRGGDGEGRIAIEAALRWLVAHQSADGSWGAEGFSRTCRGEPLDRPLEGVGRAAYDVGVTGLALCAFLGAGYTNRVQHPFSMAVAKGLQYLKSVQDPEGCFGPRTNQHYVYNHATATLAMVEAYGMTGSPIFLGSAQKALDFVAISRNPYFAWRYGVKPGDNDTSVTGWMTMALTSAKRINERALRQGRPEPLVIDEEAFQGIRAWIDKVTDPDYGRVGYIARGSGPARPQEMVDRFPAEKSESMTAVAILTRVFLGEDPRTSEMIQKGVELLRRLPPTWNPADGSIDMYYWYYGTLAMFQVGGDAWRQWSRALGQAVHTSQRTDGDPCQYQGSWDPIDPWGPDGGRVYSTALMCLCLEVTYRYDRVFGAGG